MDTSYTWRGIAHPLLCVGNIEQALRFYRDVLGFQPVEAATKNPAGFEFQAIWLNVIPDDFGQQIHLIQYSGSHNFMRTVWKKRHRLLARIAPWLHRATNRVLANHIALYVDGIDLFISQLEQHNVEILHLPTPINKGKQVYFLDPWGNLLEAIEPNDGLGTGDVFS